MQRGLQGRLLLRRVPTEAYKVFIPHDLPPDPPLALDTELHDLLEQANRALGRLDGVTLLLPDISLFLYFYVRKEAVLSSQIEGTQSSLSDLLLFESAEVPGVPLDDVQEVSNYVAALDHGLARLRADAPLTLRLLREIHEVLLSKGRGSEQQPGEFRRSQNWVSGTRPGNALYVPPPPEEVVSCMGALEKFLHDIPERTPTLLKAALAHVQFETIHPFLDGNGRLGRLLITLLLCYEKALDEPLLYLSLYFKTNRQTYYDLLQKVRMEGDWEAWLRFFLQGVWTTADQAAQTAQRILQLFDRDRRQIEAYGRTPGTSLRVHHLMQKRPLLTIPDAARDLNMAQPTVTRCLARLEEIGIVREMSGRRRNRIFVYDEYLKLLSEGTEPLR
ncbi:MAG TPA: Fic family protein [Chthonomonadaceae bacterium]|nr:Fic family protein [Chthonomonadaceae bacterium]